MRQFHEEMYQIWSTQGKKEARDLERIALKIQGVTDEGSVVITKREDDVFIRASPMNIDIISKVMKRIGHIPDER